MLSGGRGALLFLSGIAWIGCAAGESKQELHSDQRTILPTGGAASNPETPQDEAALVRIRHLREQFRAGPAADASAPHGVAPFQLPPILSPQAGTQLNRHGDRVIATFSATQPVSAAVSLPERLSGYVRVADVASKMAVEFVPRGLASDTPAQLADGLARYAVTDHSAISDLFQSPRPSGVEDYVVFARQPAVEAMSYDITLESVAGLRLVAQTLELLDAQGTPRLRVAHPFLLDSTGVIHGAQLSVDGCAFDASPLPPWGRRVVKPGADACVVTVSWRGKDIAYPAVLDPTWTTTGEMTTHRMALTATSLPGGRVLLAGGDSPEGAHPTAELFDAATLTFAATGTMTDYRSGAASALLPGGKVLVVGGFKPGAELASAELYDPLNGTFVVTGAMQQPRYALTATPLPSGAVLVAGGTGGPFGDSTDLAEVYDPQTELFAPTGAMTSPREYHAATLLDGDTVLIAGGQGHAGGADLTAEIWKESTGTFSSTGWMTTRRPWPALATLAGGKALVFGSSSADLFDLASNAFSPIFNAALSAYGPSAATPLSDNSVLLTVHAAGLFDPVLAKIVPTTSAVNQHDGGLAVLLPGDRVLVVGGYTTLADVWHKPGPGEDCSSDSECKSGLCQGRFCCASECAICSRCAEGTGACVADIYGEEPHSCSFPNTCDGNGSCRLASGQVCGSDADLCASGYCVDSVCCDSDCGGGDPNDYIACSKQFGGTHDGWCTPKIGSPCDDNHRCTTADTFTAEYDCQGTPIVCQQDKECNQTFCNPDTGDCSSYTPVADGTPCFQGACERGACVLNPETGAGGEAGVGGIGSGGTMEGGVGGAPSAGQGGTGQDPSNNEAGQAGMRAAAAGASAGADPVEGRAGERNNPQEGADGLASGGAAGVPSEDSAGATFDGEPSQPRLSRGCGCTVVGTQSGHGWLFALLYCLRMRRRVVRRNSRRRYSTAKHRHQNAVDSLEIQVRCQ